MTFGRKNGYFINSLQNTSLVDFDGKVIFNHNYKEAGLSKGTCALMKGAAVAAYVYTGVKTVQSVRMRPATNANGKPVNELYVDKSTSTYKSGAAAGTGADLLFAVARQRFNATKATKDTIHILTKFEDGVNGLVKS